MPKNCSSPVSRSADTSGSSPVSARLHALRPAGRARGVVHRRAGGPVVRQARSAAPRAGQPTSVNPGTVAVAEPARPAGSPASSAAASAGLAEPLVHEERLRLGVADDVGDLRGGEMPVDRGVVPAGLQRGQAQLLRRDPVRHQRRDAVARAQAPGAQRVHQLVDPREQVTCGVLGAVRLDHRKPVRVRLRTLPEPHQLPPIPTVQSLPSA